MTIAKSKRAVSLSHCLKDDVWDVGQGVPAIGLQQLARRVLAEQRRADVARRRVPKPIRIGFPAVITDAGFRWREAEWAEFDRRYRALQPLERDRLARLERITEAPADGDLVRWHHELLDRVLAEHLEFEPADEIPGDGKYLSSPLRIDPDAKSRGE